MRKTYLLASMVYLLISTCVFAAGGDMGGTDPNGSPEKPYLIEDIDDFDAFADSANAATYWAAGVHTKLTTDIDLLGRTYTTAVIAPDTSADFGFQGAFYSGVFDGNNLIISNSTISISNTGDYYYALFGKIGGTDTQIKNLNVETMFVTNGGTSDYIGGLVGLNDSGTITNCNWNGNINGGHTIGGLTGQNYGSIENCHAVDVTIQSYAIAGGLVGTNYGIVKDSSAAGEIIAEKDVGGLVGISSTEHTTDAVIENCSSNCTVQYTGTQDFYSTGGLVGNNDSNIRGCYATGNVTGMSEVGGLVGRNYCGSITNCYSTGSINGTENEVGGLTGDNYGGIISNCFSTATVSGNYYVGGLVGSYTARGDIGGGYIINSYSTGSVSGTTYVGGLLGAQFDGSVSNCYSTGSVNGTGAEVGGFIGHGVHWSNVNANFWDTETSSTTDGVGSEDPDPAGVLGKTTAEMMTHSTFSGWDFVNDWMMLREYEDYPRLAWQAVYAGDIAGLYGGDMVDFAYLAHYWGLDDCDGLDDCGRADIDGTGDVGLGDLLEVTNDWLFGI